MNLVRNDPVRDRRIEQVVPLVTPALVLHELPLTEQREEVVSRGYAYPTSAWRFTQALGRQSA